MLHRLALRVLPGLTLAVTEETVRKRKRLVMLAPGFVAFGLYRLIKQVDALADPAMLLCVSGVLSAITALVAFRVGRQVRFERLLKEDGVRRLGWIVGWIGFVYGVQLSLLVLALLKVFVQYDFLRHPDGPAMMAMIISCTSVARDAFEIGHVRWLQAAGRPILTFPDGRALRDLFRDQPMQIAQWILLGGSFSALIAAGVSALGQWGGNPLSQLAAVALAAGMMAVWSYLAGIQRAGMFATRWSTLRYSDLFRFWWWPGLAFAATYYLVAVGLLTFLIRVETLTGPANGLVAGTVGGLMAIYGYYLGYRRYEEDRVQQIIPASLLRCPFVAGILRRNGKGTISGSLASPGVVLGESGRQG